MPSLQPSDVAALAVADIHLSHKPPLARSQEEDWYVAMRRPLRQLKHLQKIHNDCPVLIAGDLFDDGWRMHKVPPELINFAIQELPDKCYGVPGNHDLPYHRLDLIRKSAFWTLVEAGKLRYLPPGESANESEMCLWGFPLGCPVKPPDRSPGLALSVAVIHSYIWRPGCNFYGASEETSTRSYHTALKGYDVAVFGDNHIGFTITIKRSGGHTTRVVNCGGFMRRTSDEKDRQPVVTLIHRDGSITQEPLDTNQDKFVSTIKEHKALLGDKAEEFLSRLNKLRDSRINLQEGLEHYFREHNVDEGIQTIIFQAMDKKKAVR